MEFYSMWLFSLSLMFLRSSLLFKLYVYKTAFDCHGSPSRRVSGVSRAPDCRRSYSDKGSKLRSLRMFAAASLFNLKQLPSLPRPIPKASFTFWKCRGKPDFKRQRADVPNASLYLKIKVLVFFLIRLVQYVCYKKNCKGGKLHVYTWLCVYLCGHVCRRSCDD